MDFKKMIFDVAKVAIGFTVGLAIYNKLLGGTSMMAVESAETTPDGDAS
jgi:hypothetical protein